MTEPAFGDVDAVPRDHWGRPRVTPVDGGKLVAYTRATQYVSAAEDQTLLRGWDKRNVARGLVVDPDVFKEVADLGPEPEDPAELKAWKAGMEDATYKAMNAAGAFDNQRIGTKLHHWTEQLDRGLPVDAEAANYNGRDYTQHLANYQAATAGFTILHNEQFTVLDELKIGGTPDRIITIDGLEGAWIADLKTGGTEYGIHKMGGQLAVYAHSVLYDPVTAARAPYIQPVSQTDGLIIALDATTGACTFFWVDLVEGWEWVNLCTTIRAARRRKPTKRPYIPSIDLATGEVLEVTPALPALTQPASTASIIALINTAGSVEELHNIWRVNKNAWTDGYNILAVHRKAELAASALTQNQLLERMNA